MAQQHSPRRSAQQWQSLVEHWQQSNQSATQFCREQEIGYASFCHWRKRLQPGDGSAPRPTGSDQASNGPAFIDLASLDGCPASGWHIVLRLGQGVELTLSRS